MPDPLLQAIALRWKEFRRLRREVLRRWDHEDVHDLRVATRRFRAALELVKPLCRRRNFRILRSVGEVTGGLGSLRNLDEAIIFFGKYAGFAGGSDLVERFRNMREAELSRAERLLGEFRPHRCKRAIRRLRRGRGVKRSGYRRTRPLEAYLYEIAGTGWERVRRLLPPSLVRENHCQRHELRITIKKLRYFMEIASPLLGWPQAPLTRLRKYQGALGRMNDLSVFGTLAAEAGIGAERLAAVEELLSKEQERLFGEWQELVAAEPLAWVLADDFSA